MDIESKTSIYEEKEETQEVNPEEQKSEIKSEKEKEPGTSDCSDRCGCYSGDWRDYGGAQAQ